MLEFNEGPLVEMSSPSKRLEPVLPANWPLPIWSPMITSLSAFAVVEFTLPKTCAVSPIFVRLKLPKSIVPENEPLAVLLPKAKVPLNPDVIVTPSSRPLTLVAPGTLVTASVQRTGVLQFTFSPFQVWLACGDACAEPEDETRAATGRRSKK